MGRKMSKVQIEDMILARTKIWWDMTIDNSWDDMMASSREDLFAYIQVFQKANNEFVKKHNKLWWIQIQVILADLEVMIDRDEGEEDKAMWEDTVACLDFMWPFLEQALL